MTTSYHRIALGENQISALEINIFDPAHDEDEPAFPGMMEGAYLFVEVGAEDAACLRLHDAANSEDDAWERERDQDAKKARNALSALATRVRKLAS